MHIFETSITLCLFGKWIISRDYKFILYKVVQGTKNFYKTIEYEMNMSSTVICMVWVF